MLPGPAEVPSGSLSNFLLTQWTGRTLDWYRTLQEWYYFWMIKLYVIHFLCYCLCASFPTPRRFCVLQCIHVCTFDKRRLIVFDRVCRVECTKGDGVTCMLFNAHLSVMIYFAYLLYFFSHRTVFWWSHTTRCWHTSKLSKMVEY